MPDEIKARPHEPVFSPEVRARQRRVAAEYEAIQADLSAQRLARDEGAECCPTVADDGEQCKIAPHPDDPTAHQFGRQPTNPIDGGQKWSVWINMVNNFRHALIGTEVHVSGDNSQLILQLAQLAGLTHIPSDVSGCVIITDDPAATWRTYKGKI